MSPYEILLYVCVFLYGIVIGSFLNVCILRIPAKESIVSTGSHCMNCGKKIKWYDLVPVFSYVILKGRCRQCKEKISAQYPIVELLNAVCYLILFLVKGFSVNTICLCLASSALIVISFIDFRTLEIPVSLNVFILCVAVFNLAFDYTNWLSYIIGFFAVSVFLFICFIVTGGKGIGGGDIKLMACAGLLVGVKEIVFALVVGCIVGSIIQLIRMKVSKAGRLFAFGPYLAIGIFISMLYASNFYDWYLGLVLS